jgi:hypothetical protein
LLDLDSSLLSCDHALESALQDRRVATIVELDVDGPQSSDRNASSKRLFHIESPFQMGARMSDSARPAILKMDE